MKLIQQMPFAHHFPLRITRRVTRAMLAVALVLSTTTNAQEIFRWVDKDGKVHYGDSLPPPAR